MHRGRAVIDWDWLRRLNLFQPTCQIRYRRERIGDDVDACVPADPCEHAVRPFWRSSRRKAADLAKTDIFSATPWHPLICPHCLTTLIRSFAAHFRQCFAGRHTGHHTCRRWTRRRHLFEPCFRPVYSSIGDPALEFDSQFVPTAPAPQYPVWILTLSGHSGGVAQATRLTQLGRRACWFCRRCAVEVNHSARH